MSYRITSRVPNNKEAKILEGKNWDSSLFLPLINYKELNKKGKVGYKKKLKNIVISRLNNRYELYIELLKTQDNLNNIYLFNEDEEYISNNIYLNIIRDKNKMIKLFNENINIEDSHYLNRKFIRKNILDENYNDLESRKMSNKLLLPHYFFTGRFNEKSMPSQIRSWTNSVYSFLKKDKSSIKHIDIYTGKLLKLFFSLKYIKTRRIWNVILFNAYKIVPHIFIIKYMNRMIRYTSMRSTWSLSKISNYPSVILTMIWLQKQIRYASILNKYIRSRKNTLFGLYKPKMQAYYRKRRRGWLSKPLFKHTADNLVIDLFIFNNKKNNIRKFSNILSRRALYKYMYSMYINYKNKVKETINRPRFFYINLIEPNTYNYYSNIVKTYEELLVKKNKTIFLLISILVLKWNKACKNYIQLMKNKILFSKYNSIMGVKNKFNKNWVPFSLNNNVIYNKTIINDINDYLNILFKDFNNKNNLIELNYNSGGFKKCIYFRDNNAIKKKEFFYLNNYDIINENKKIHRLYDLNKNIFLQKIQEKDKNKKKKNILWRKPKYLKLRKYLLNLEKKSSVSVDSNKLTLWSRKGLGEDIINKKSGKTIKTYGYNKYSLEEFKRKIYYAKGKTKRKIAPGLWKAKLMDFHLSFKSQKKESRANRNFVNYKENELYKYVENKLNLKNDMKNRINIGENRFNKNKEKNYVNSKYLNNFGLKKNFINEEINMFNDKNINLFKGSIDKININNKIFNKKKYIKNIIKINQDKTNILNDLYKRFYLLNSKRNMYLGLICKKKAVLSYINTNSSTKIYNNLLSNIKRNNIWTNNFNKKMINCKYEWDNLDFSIINIINKTFMNYTKYNDQFKFSSYNNLFNKINNIVINSDMLYLDLIKKEFYIVNRDVIFSKVMQEKSINIYNEKDTNTFINQNVYNNFVLNFSIVNKKNKGLDKDQSALGINIWPSYVKDKSRNNYLEYKIEYLMNIFKPYYRYMLPLFIYESYKSFMNYLGYGNWLNKKVLSNHNWIKSNNLIIFNFIIVRTLLDLLRYNYRSLIRIKPKYYYLNTIRYYGSKIKRLQFNTWIASVKYIKRLRKTPRHFWKRYNKLVSFYFGRVIQSANLNTKRKILLPFVMYFEDLLYIIYGKWGIVRLWPIKRYYLNSYILAERIMIILVIRRKKWNAIKEYRKSARKLISIFRWFQIKKAYDYINEYNTRWPNSLINTMKDNNSRHSLNYNQLEFFDERLEKYQMLNTYPIEKNYLKSYLSTVNSHYVHMMYNYIIKLNKSINIKRMFLRNEGKMKAQLYVSHWLKPLNTYIFTMKQGIDITGVRFRLSGRTGVSASNARRFKKFYFFGNLIGPRHYNKRMRKITNLTNPILRNTIKSNIDYAYSVGVNRNGCINLKVWLSSLFSADIHELLLHLIRIKHLYNQLINRYFPIHSKFANFNYNWLLYYNNNNQFYINDYAIGNKEIEKLEVRRTKYILNKRLVRKRRGVFLISKTKSSIN